MALALGFQVLYANHRDRVHRSFFVLSTLMALLHLNGIIFQTVQTPAAANLIYKASILLLPYMIMCFLLFLSLLAGSTIRTRPFLPVFVGIPLLITIFIVTRPAFITVEFIDDAWRMNAVEHTPALCLMHLLFCIYASLPAVLLAVWRRRTRLRREKRQAIVLLASYLLGMTIGLGELYITLYLHPVDYFGNTVPGRAYLYMNLWYIGIGIAMSRYRLLRLTPEQVARDIMDNIEESVMLVNTGERIISWNRMTERITGCNALYDRELRHILKEYDRIRNDLAALADTVFTCRLQYVNLSRETAPTLVDARFSLIRDRYGDRIGTLVIAREVKGLPHFRERYRITRSEEKIILFLATGSGNREIAGFLGITVNTLKRHIANIYNKLDVCNKLQLMHILKEFNILRDDTRR